MEIPIILGLSMASLLISLISIGIACYVLISFAQRHAQELGDERRKDMKKQTGLSPSRLEQVVNWLH